MILKEGKLIVDLLSALKVQARIMHHPVCDGVPDKD